MANPFPTKTIITSGTPTPQTRQTDAPSSSCPPNAVIVKISTVLSIPNYKQFYAQPIDYFTPAYDVRQDGSLLTAPFKEDLLESNLALLVLSALALLFLRNIIVSGDYLRRGSGKFKKKKLFHALFFSQILAIGAFVPLLLSYFTPVGNCTLMFQFACLFAMSSISILLTFIYGYKIYKCLDKPKILLFFLGAFQAGSTAVMILDMYSTVGDRRLTGSCTRTNSLIYVRYYITIQFLESLFICSCFMFVLYRCRRSPAVRGRISIELSMYDVPPPSTQEIDSNLANTEIGPQDSRVTAPRTLLRFRKLPIFSRKTRKPFQEKEMSQSTVSSKREEVRENQVNDTSSRRSSASRFSRLSRLIPRMELFQQVMKDELYHTTFITCSFVVIAVMAVFGVNIQNCLSIAAWIVLNWGVISFLAVHSFGRVVRRHERDALLSHPFTCTQIRQTAADMARSAENSRSLPRISSSIRFEEPLTPTDLGNDPFRDPTPVIDTNTTAPGLERSNQDFDTSGGVSPQEADFPTSCLGTPLQASYNFEHSSASDKWLVFSKTPASSIVGSRRSSFEKV